MKKAYFALLIPALLIISIGVAFSEGEAPAQATSPVIVTAPEAEAQSEPDIQWLWGEVVSADAPANAMTVKYLDYENDQEREMLITVEAKTTFENVKSLAEVKPKDTVSVDYIISSDAKNTAKNISVEKIEGMQPPLTVETPQLEPTAVTPAVTIAPAAAAPAAVPEKAAESKK